MHRDLMERVAGRLAPHQLNRLGRASRAWRAASRPAVDAALARWLDRHEAREMDGAVELTDEHRAQVHPSIAGIDVIVAEALVDEPVVCMRVATADGALLPHFYDGFAVDPPATFVTERGLDLGPRCLMWLAPFENVRVRGTDAVRAYTYNVRPTYRDGAACGPVVYWRGEAWADTRTPEGRARVWRLISTEPPPCSLEIRLPRWAPAADRV